MANRELAPLTTRNNLIKRVNANARKLEALSRATVKTNQASALFNDLGEQRAFDFLTAPSGTPDDGSYSGSFVSANGYTFGSTWAHIGGVYNGTLQWGGNSVTGKFTFLNGNATIDSDGITGTDLLKWMIKQTAINSTYTRIGKLGMALAEGGGTIPVWQLSYESPAGSELITNGDFETGDFAGWTKTTETNCSWSVFNNSGDYVAKCAVSSASSTGVLTSNRITSITAGVSYLFSSELFVSAGPTSVQENTLEVKWYDAASGGSLIQTDQINRIGLAYSGSSRTAADAVPVTAPASALSFEIVCTYTSSAYTSGINGRLNYVSASAVSVNTKIWLEDIGVQCSNGLYPHYVEQYWDKPATSGAINETQTRTSKQNYHYFYESGGGSGNLNSTYTFPNVCLAAGTYNLYILFRGNTGNAILGIYIDDVEVGEIDLYKNPSEYNSIGSDEITISSNGVHALMFKVTGENPSAIGNYYVRVTKHWFERTGS